MSTHASISIKRKDGTVRTYYCHYDGQMRNTGKALIENYNAKNVHKLDTGVAIRAVMGGLEFFNDKHGVYSYSSEMEFLKSAITDDFEYNYYWDGQAWFLILDEAQISLKNVNFFGRLSDA